MAHCADCRLPYSDPGFADLVVADDVFAKVHDSSKFGDGLLCPTCLVRRCALAGVRDVEAVFKSGPFTGRHLDFSGFCDETIAELKQL